MNRYNVIRNKIKREIVLLKGRPCCWGRCRFCDYIADNSRDEQSNTRINSEVLQNVTGVYGVLEVINSGNVFELPQATLEEIRQIIRDNEIHTLFFESHWIYREKIDKMREYFGIKVIVKTGVESFNDDFRENILNKGFGYRSLAEIKENFDSVCLLVGIKGQTREMIQDDIKIASENFDHFTVNIFMKNSTDIEPDLELIDWFRSSYQYLDDLEKCDVLWNNTDFGVGK
jgi:histone acetyltransferase (RNA polymerase elongator complex component)